MTTIIFKTPSGEEYPLQGQGGSLMELAVANNISGIDGDCGGVCSCATCHVHVAPEDFAKTGEPNEIEKDMLELADNLSETSRLCCQIDVTDAIDGITVTVARK